MADMVARNLAAPSTPVMPIRKKDADYVFYELTRSICPECRRVIDAQILLRHNKVYMRKRCPEHGCAGREVCPALRSTRVHMMKAAQNRRGRYAATGPHAWSFKHDEARSDCRCGNVSGIARPSGG